MTSSDIYVAWDSAPASFGPGMLDKGLKYTVSRINAYRASPGQVRRVTYTDRPRAIFDR